MMLNKRAKPKIINDPVHGFISIPDGIIFDLIEHPWFQRLRRIKQLSLTHLVYPGALHTRFHHALGAMHLTNLALETLTMKGIEVSDEEHEATLIAILLHDIGHGPYSHTLENSLVGDISHEDLSLMFMQRLNEIHGDRLTLAIKIFDDNYPKRFLHRLVSSQLDMDRLDYLKRDSFYTGVAEGVISTERLISMLDVVDDDLVIEAKGIYSVEKFIIARRLMYWQVYLHKTVMSAEYMLVQALRRAKFLIHNGESLFCSPTLSLFLKNNFVFTDFEQNRLMIEEFARLDDFDIFLAIKVWCDHHDKVLSFLCNGLVGRRLFKTEMKKNPYSDEEICLLRNQISAQLNISFDESSFLIYHDIVMNKAYNPANEAIKILLKDGNTIDIEQASDQLNISALSQPVAKFFVSYPKFITQNIN